MGERTTNHIVIDVDDESDAYELFEEIQNRFSLYDNCVIETEVPQRDSIRACCGSADPRTLPATTNHIRIEVDDEAAAREFFGELRERYGFEDNCVLDTGVPSSESIQKCCTRGGD